MHSARCTDSPWLMAPSSQPTQRANWPGLQPRMNHSSTCHCTSCKGVVTSSLSFFTISVEAEPLIKLKPKLPAPVKIKLADATLENTFINLPVVLLEPLCCHSHLDPLYSKGHTNLFNLNGFIPFMLGVFNLFPDLYICKNHWKCLLTNSSLFAFSSQRKDRVMWMKNKESVI